jgi:hypothetical protein
MVALEDIKEGTSLEWAIGSMRGLLENTSPPGKAKYMLWLDELEAAKSHSSVSGLREKSLRIWHEERSITNTALSHLYAALVYLMERNTRAYRTTIIDALCVMGENEYFRATGVQIPLTLFERMTSGGR